MFDSIGWTEMMVVGVVALIVVGPKDLPKMFHAVGEFTGKARGMAREFQRAMNVAAKEAGVDGLAKDLKNTASGKTFKDAVGFDEIDKEFRDIGRVQPDVRKGAEAKSATAKSADGDFSDSDEADADVSEAAAYDADMAARNSELTATEVERLKKAERSAAARQKAAAIRADNEAQAAEAEAAKASATAEPKAKSKSKTKAKSKAKSKAKAASDKGNSTESQS